MPLGPTKQKSPRRYGGSFRVGTAVIVGIKSPGRVRGRTSVSLAPRAVTGSGLGFIGPDAVHITRGPGNAFAQRLLDPSWLLTHDLDQIGEGEVGGRRVLEVRATARSARPRSGGATDMASERDLVVDAERGFLHSDTALVDGQPYELAELREVVVDPDVDIAAFNPEIPRGLRVDDHTNDATRRPWERRRQWHFRWPISRW